jgi:hypothetical protein
VKKMSDTFIVCIAFWLCGFWIGAAIGEIIAR